MDQPSSLSKSFNEAGSKTFWIQSYPFKPYRPDDPDKSKFTYQEQEYIRKTIATWETFLSVDMDVRQNTYRPAWHDKRPDPTPYKHLYDEMVTNIKDKQGRPEILAQMPPHIQQDKILQLAYLVDGDVDARLKQDDQYDEKTIGRDYMFHPYDTLKNGKGDCDDYAILKRKMLRDLGVPDDRVYLMVGKDSEGAHMMCVIIGDDGKSYVIDNNPGGKPSLTPLDQYIEHYGFQPMVVMRDDEVMVLSDDKFNKNTPKTTPLSTTPTSTPSPV